MPSGRVPEDLIPSVRKYYARVVALRGEINRLIAEGRSLLVLAERAARANMAWVADRAMDDAREVITQLRTAVDWLDQANKKLEEKIREVYNFKIAVNTLATRESVALWREARGGGR